MPDKFTFELVSPERVLATVEADMVVVPGEEGDFGVLAGHAPMLSTIRPGVLRIYDGESVTQRLFVEGGFAEVKESGLVVLAEAAVDAEEIDITSANQMLSDARDDLGELGGDVADTSAERRRAERRCIVAEARVDAANGVT